MMMSIPPLNRAGKLVHFTLSTKNMGITPQLEVITEPPGWHLQDEKGTITSKSQTFFLRSFESQTRREQAAMEMAERHRIARNAALNTYVGEMLQWRKDRKLWEYNIKRQMWAEDKRKRNRQWANWTHRLKKYSLQFWRKNTMYILINAINGKFFVFHPFVHTQNLASSRQNGVVSRILTHTRLYRRRLAATMYH